MSGIMMMVIAIVVLGGAYLLYGRYLQNKWGIDPKAKTPAYPYSAAAEPPKPLRHADSRSGFSRPA